MPLIPLQIPPGVYNNGTDIQASGRWRDASLVRWADGAMRPIGGWLTRVAITDQPIRGALAWRDGSSDRWLAAGTFEGLFVAKADNTVTDITPAGFTTGDAVASVNTGYGGGLYGMDAYGIARPDTGVYSTATTWSLDTWGENLVACSSVDGALREWDLNVANNAEAITNAPTGCAGLLVTEERFLVALAPGGNSRRVQWSDREDNTTWTAAATNEAGDIELQTIGQIMLGIKSRGQSLILTSTSAHSMTYQGPPFVYGFERVGSACGAVSRLCAASADAGVFWMGLSGFFVYSGGAVQELPCDVSGYVFDDINAVQISLVAAVMNADNSEVWWFYPSGASVENNRYVSYNIKEGHWSIGAISRTCGVDTGVFSTPIWFDAAGNAINHEVGNQTDGGEVFAESGPIQLGAGDNVMYATALIPDEQTQGEVTTSFSTRFHPNDTERTYGPYSMAAPTDVRFSGRQVSIKVIGDQNTGWRWGIPRLEAKAGGLR